MRNLLIKIKGDKAMTIKNEKAREMWNRYLESIGEEINNTEKISTAWYFCDNQESAKKLAELVKIGVKKATASLHYWYSLAGEPLPKEGEFSVVTDYKGVPQCIIKATKINIVQFKDVTEEFAFAEGEGDKTLDYWREVHTKLFTKELEEIGKAFSQDMDVICEEFELVYM